MNVDRIATLLALMATHLNEIALELKGAPDQVGPYTGGDSSAPAETPEAQEPVVTPTSEAAKPAPEITLDKFRQLTRDLVARSPTAAPGLIRPLIASMGIEGGVVDIPEERRMDFLRKFSQAIKDATEGGPLPLSPSYPGA